MTLKDVEVTEISNPLCASSYLCLLDSENHEESWETFNLYTFSSLQ